MSTVFSLALILIPLIAAATVFFYRKSAAKIRAVSIGFALIELIVCVFAAVLCGKAEIVTNAAFTLFGFSSFMAVICAFSWFVATICSSEQISDSNKIARYFIFWFITESLMMGAFLCSDLLLFFVFFELISFASYMLVLHNEDEFSVRASTLYLAVAVVCGMISFLGLALIYSKTGSLRFSELGKFANSSSLIIPAAVTMVAFAAKAGVFPLHFWVPSAYCAAPAPASSVLSAVIKKVGVFVLIILSVRLFSGFGVWGLALLVIGVITMLLGALMALLSVNIKYALACSSISQVGFITVGISMLCLLGDSHNAVAAFGTVLHVLNHSIIKLILFNAVGILLISFGSLNINDLKGIGRKKPLLALLFFLPMMSLAGLPGLSGYVSKTLLHESMVELLHELQAHGSNLYSYIKASEILFLVAGGLTLAYMLKYFVAIFIEKTAPANDKIKPKNVCCPRSFYALLVCAFMLPVLGLLPNVLMDRLAFWGTGLISDAKMHSAVNYFSFENLKGSLVSILIGLSVYFAVVRGLLIRKGMYIDTASDFYAALTSLFSKLLKYFILPLEYFAGLLNLAAETLIKSAVWLAVNLAQAFDLSVNFIIKLAPNVGVIISRVFDSAVNGALQLGRFFLLHRQTSNILHREDDYFASYENVPVKISLFYQTLVYGLAITVLGAVLFISYLIYMAVK
ncbi:MAG: NADH dehydrogenase [Ruminococcaceae bacterium]|nr:NADH dehydrogenase [Oscillospiraceae bacterium]